MTMQRWDPFADFRRADDILNRFFSGAARGVAPSAGRWDFPMDVLQDGDDLIVRASLPGVSPDEIGVTIEDGLLTIEGAAASESERREGGGEYLLRERRSGRFHRVLRLPGSVDANKASPVCENGVLTITLPKREAKKARRLEIKTG